MAICSQGFKNVMHLSDYMKNLLKVNLAQSHLLIYQKQPYWKNKHIHDPEEIILILFFVLEVFQILEFEVKWISNHMAIMFLKAYSLTSLDLSLYIF